MHARGAGVLSVERAVLLAYRGQKECTNEGVHFSVWYRGLRDTPAGASICSGCTQPALRAEGDRGWPVAGGVARRPQPRIVSWGAGTRPPVPDFKHPSPKSTLSPA